MVKFRWIISSFNGNAIRYEEMYFYLYVWMHSLYYHLIFHWTN